ncbi:uncharacterized protein LOC110813331 isoform X2 [Carica papaya]|uniref:uncharacterized protein LOC110813331 isoform X2 n=1 Tax=Carica papaya TaxID=3649 RepID=UPI000B8CF658|nr:uncharacterized protein LOC110813331 isoform X2 [Carica papaya]
MELTLQPLSSPSFSTRIGDSKPNVSNLLGSKGYSLVNLRALPQRKNLSKTPSALPETAASLAIAVTIVGAAATILVKRTKASGETEVPLITCEDCGGSGICSECNGEGFVQKKLSDESAERARMAAKNMATRYTAGFLQGLMSKLLDIIH